MHLECDVSAMENNLGYGLGDWVPYLTVDYDVVGTEEGNEAHGTFMVMSASDGPHYGANIALPNADTYTVTFTFHSPAENGYLIHSDAETGPGGLLEDYFADGNLTVTTGTSVSGFYPDRSLEHAFDDYVGKFLDGLDISYTIAYNTSSPA